MAQDIQIAGAIFNAVPSIVVPVAGGGSATFVDPSPTTAAAADVASGKLFFDALGVLTQGSASGGGGGGLVYETGEYKPTSDTARPTISFANTHSTPPFYVLIADATDNYGTSGVASTNMAFEYTDWWRLTGAGLYYSSSTIYYGVANYWYRSTNASQFTTNRTYLQYNSDNTGSGTTPYPRYWVTPSEFKPYTNSTSRYWRSGRTYKWIAVWKP